MTDSAYMGSESTYSECETFTDEDTSTLVHHEMHDEVETDSAIDSTVHSEFTDPIEEPEHGSVAGGCGAGGGTDRRGQGLGEMQPEDLIEWAEPALPKLVGLFVVFAASPRPK